jgi:transcriptional regulator with GAF, ATPase, and Fis domain/tetratricopeptide (TPR) repeat protein
MLLADTPGAMTQPASVHVHTPTTGGRCFGREEEIGRLSELFERGSSFVLLSGKASVGKSTVLSEVQRRLGSQGALVLEGRCRPGLPSFAPLLDVAREGLRQLCLCNHHSEAAEELLCSAERVLEVLGGRASGGPETNLATLRLNLFDQLARLLAELSQIRPLLVALHDLDHADPGTLQLWGYLGRVLACRPELSGAGPGGFRGLLLASATEVPDTFSDPLWVEGVELHHVRLGGLSAEGVRAFLSSEEVVERVLQVTGGDPATLRAAMSQGLVGSRPTKTLEQVEPSERRLLQVLAVVGRPLGPETLRLLTGLPHSGLGRMIKELARRQVVEKVVVDGELRVGFARAGDQTAVYQSLDAEERRAIHARVGEYLEARGEAELEACAGHLLLGNCGQRAVSATLAAGRRLELSLCFERAADLYERALAVADDPVQQELRARLCGVYEVVGQLDRALEHARRHRQEAQDDPEASLRIVHLELQRRNLSAARRELDGLQQLAGEDSTLTARIVAEAAWAHYLAGEKEAAQQAAERGLELCACAGAGAAEEQLVRARLRLQNTLGKIRLEAKQHEAAQALFLDNLALARTTDLTADAVLALIQLGLLGLEQGDFEGAERWYGEALRLAESIGEHRLRGGCLQHLGVIAERRCEYGRALDLYQEAVNVWKKAWLRSYLAWVALDLGKLYAKLGDVERATAMADLFQRLGDAEAEAAAQANLELLRGQIARLECRFQEAAERFVRAGRMSADTGGTERELTAQLELAATHLEQGRPEQALATLPAEPAVQSRPGPRLRTVLLAGRAELELDQVARAKQLLGEALELSDEAQDLESAWQARHFLAAVAREEGRSAEAKRLLREAAAIEARIRETVPQELRESLAGQPLRLALQRALTDTGVRVSSRARGAGRAQASTQATPASFCGLVGRHPRMRQVYAHVEKVAPTDGLVLVRGESGTGKELVAEAIHLLSRRADKPLVKVNCAALVESLLLSELFGHERGAFTGATERRKGRFEVANGGTIFLDEIGDISPKTQVALLRVLQTQEFERVGGTTPVRVDVRIICATNRDLEEMVAKGTFRQDLYYRLRGFVIDVPPLRERIEDVALLAEHFLAIIAKERGTPVKRLTPEAQRVLACHRWRGNVRELENVLRSVSLMADADLIDVDDFADYHELGIEAEDDTAESSGQQQSHYDAIRSSGLSLREFKKQVELECIVKALAEAKGSVTKAAELLGMKRPRLSQLVKEHGITVR